MHTLKVRMKVREMKKRKGESHSPFFMRRSLLHSLYYNNKKS